MKLQPFSLRQHYFYIYRHTVRFTLASYNSVTFADQMAFSKRGNRFPDSGMFSVPPKIERSLFTIPPKLQMRTTYRNNMESQKQLPHEIKGHLSLLQPKSNIGNQIQHFIFLRCLLYHHKHFGKKIPQKVARR